MPKRALAPHPDDPNAKKKKRNSDNPGKDCMPTDGEMMGMSVREKLLAGISSGFAKIQKQQQQNAAHNSQNYCLVATLQQYMDDGFHVNPKILKTLKAPSQSQTMMFPEEEEEESLESDISQRKEMLTHHFCRRIDQRQDTSRRLQAVMRLANDNPFMPPAGALNQQGPGEDLRLFLHSACRKYGYRKLQLDLLGFLSIKVSKDFRGECLGSVPMPANPEAGDCVRIDAKKGSLTIYESDVLDEVGRISTWLWLKICRPLESYEQPRHFLAPDMSDDKEAWTIVAIPKSQVEVVLDDWFPRDPQSEMTNGDYIMESATPDPAPPERRKPQIKVGAIAIRYSRDGVPSMACSKKTGDVDSAWFGFRTDLDEMHWDMVHGAMMTNSCLVHGFSKPGVGWITVAPEKAEPLRQSGGTRRSSRLKQEVHLEE
ncbi:hypothetical protein ACHAQJ_008325 [Trichoderma viride]